MTPPRAAEALRRAEPFCRRHAGDCPTCGPPAPDRCPAGCDHGRRLALSYSGAWRSAIDALSRSEPVPPRAPDR